MRERLKNNTLVLWRAYNRWQEDDGPLMSAAVAYYLGLSLFPMLLLLIAGIGVFFRYTAQGQDAEQEVLKFVGSQVSPALERLVRDMLAQVQDRSSVGGPLGIIGILLAAIVGFTQFERAFDHIWSVPASDDRGILASLRHTLLERGVAFLMLLCVAILVILVFVASVTIAALDSYFSKRLGFHAISGSGPRVAVSIALNTMLFSQLYRFLPPVKVRWSEAIRAGLLAAACWELGRVLLSSYVIGTRYTSAYGLVGSFLAVLLWCYYAVAVIFLAAEYLKEICTDCSPASPAAADAGGAAAEPGPHKDILHSAEDA
jgi:membrane protein